MPSVDKSLELHSFENCPTELVLGGVQLNIWGREIHATDFLCCLAKEQHLPPLSYSGKNVEYYPEAEHPPVCGIVHAGIFLLSVFYSVLSCTKRARKGSLNTSNSTNAISSLRAGLDFCFNLYSGTPTTSCFWKTKEPSVLKKALWQCLQTCVFSGFRK